jgi:hypothetical protein
MYEVVTREANHSSPYHRYYNSTVCNFGSQANIPKYIKKKTKIKGKFVPVIPI